MLGVHPRTLYGNEGEVCQRGRYDVAIPISGRQKIDHSIG